MKLNKIYSRMKNHAHFYTSNLFIFKKFSPTFLITKSLMRFLKLILCNTSVSVLNKNKVFSFPYCMVILMEYLI